MRNRHHDNVLQTTLAELTVAYFEAALAELGDERMAERVATRLVVAAVRSGQAGLR